MKKSVFICIAFWLSLWAPAQSVFESNINLRDLDGKIVQIKELLSPGKAALVVFWKSSDKRCCDNLENLNEAWSGSLVQLDIRMIVINIDCAGPWTNLKPMVQGNGWDFETYIDVNCDLKRIMCVGDGPCSMLFNQNAEMVCRFNSACMLGPEIVCKDLLDHLRSDLTVMK